MFNCDSQTIPFAIFAKHDICQAQHMSSPAKTARPSTSGSANHCADGCPSKTSRLPYGGHDPDNGDHMKRKHRAMMPFLLALLLTALGASASAATFNVLSYGA